MGWKRRFNDDVESGVVLIRMSFLTNPIPDPSFSYTTRPAPLRIAYIQPRIEHWPVPYTVGLWLVVFTFPLVLSYTYQRYGLRDLL